MSKRNPIFTIKKSDVETWGYEFKCRKLHYWSTAPTVEAARRFILGRYGRDVEIRVLNRKGA